MWAGTLSARHVIYLTGNLQTNPHSQVFAIRGGTPELQGWDTQAGLIARLINTLLAVVGVKDPSAFVHYPTAQAEEMPFKTIAEFSEASFSKFMGV
ncbi:hypothetical protein [Microbacterium sp. No. 7]|uniref:hypothetical protein n=1 Tax=Microbacterium sp. No. 7 TaxID=1714373 RepID=UPI0012E1421A|nr:hypothetical protein [Microbacterium sp. No. 7]